MRQAFTHFTGIAGLALFLANFVPDALSTPLAAFLIQDAPAAADGLDTVNRASKSDRLTSSRPTRNPVAVSSVEMAGEREATIVLRDRLGNIVYRSDPLTSTTIVSRDADISSVAVETARSPTVTRPAPNPESRDGGGEKAKRSIPAGCEGVVSALVNHELRRVPSLCLAQAEGARSS